MAAEEPIPFFDATPLTRRARHRAVRTVVVGAVGIAAAIAVLFAGVAEIRSAPASIPANTPEQPSVDLGIFGPPPVGSSTATTRPLRHAVAQLHAGARGRPPMRTNEHVAARLVDRGTQLLVWREDPTDTAGRSPGMGPRLR